jgi:hypothetical protein
MMDDQKAGVPKTAYEQWLLSKTTRPFCEYVLTDEMQRLLEVRFSGVKMSEPDTKGK